MRFRPVASEIERIIFISTIAGFGNSVFGGVRVRERTLCETAGRRIQETWSDSFRLNTWGRFPGKSRGVFPKALK
jgi:hypothetical protein